MTADSGDLSWLEHPLATELLSSTALARLAYVWTDGTPRVVPVWYHWNGTAVVICSPPNAPKIAALEQHPDVSVTIDTDTWPYHVLSIRGRVSIEHLDDLAPEYAMAAERYMGPEGGRAWAEGLRGRPVYRLSIVPTWANVLDFEQRFPSALSV